ncbi:uncharacterized protein IL334_003639 [Kwoniella shivajii]|uniref:Uncharacterized protein n=1 Tax=Kwoniella shivajii TaxID=564305 RepID=A0ABZ1CZW6_9TREE|nr:hypothetical protein IL334_003639 [Kwoniella shivajii]
MAKILQQWEAEERKLQSVYDDISSHRLIPAQSTLTRYLKKHAKSQPALILKMYINQKTGSTEQDILNLYDQVKSLGDMTGRGVWWSGLTLRNMGRRDLALKLYLDLSEQVPDSPPLLEQVFLHAAAAEDVDALVKSSRKLFNLTRDERWARASAWSEWVKNAPQPTPSKPFPHPVEPFSCKIALLLLNTSKTPTTSETLWLKLQILLSAGQLDDALRFVQDEGKQGGLVRLHWRMEGVKEILSRMESDKKVSTWKEERDWVSKLLKDDKDSQRNYAYYRYLLFTIQDIPTDLRAVESIDELLVTLEKEIGSKERAPSLARLELQSSIRRKNVPSSILLDDERWLKLVEQYWIKWGSKGPIVTELEGIIGDDDIERKEIMREFVTKQARSHTDEQSFREQVNAEIYLLRNKNAEWKPTPEGVKKYWDLYLSGSKYGKNLPKTDVRPADTIGLVAISLLLEMWSNSKEDITLSLRAVVCLEKIVNDSPACAHGHYLLIRLYRLIGAYSLIPPHLSSLKISEIQLDNLLHIFTERGASESILGNNQEIWNDHMKKAGDMYQRTSIDFPEYVKECLTNETYSKIPSIQYISSSLSYSMTNHTRTIEQARLATYIGAPYGVKLLQKLDLALKEEEKVDLRNWELIYEIGGSRPLIRDLTSLGGEVNSSWMKSLAGLYRDMGNFTSGEEVQERTTSSEGLLPAEIAMIKSANQLLKSASRAISSTEEVEQIHLQSIYEESVRLCLSDHSSRWEQTQSFTCLYELIKILDLVITRVTEANKPVKGKKKSPSIVQLVTALKEIKESLKDASKPVLEKIELLSKDVVNWSHVLEDWINDEPFVAQTTKAIADSRRDALIGVKTLLSGGGASVKPSGNTNTSKKR